MLTLFSNPLPTPPFWLDLSKIIFIVISASLIKRCLECNLETNLASRWEGVRLPRASGKSPDFPGSSPNFPGSFSATSPEVLPLWNLTAIPEVPRKFPELPRKFPKRKFPDFPGGQPLSLGSLTPSPDLSDPRNRNHKSLAIGNHNFEIASFSRRNRSKIAVSQSQKSHSARKIAAIRNHTLVVATYFGGFADPCGASEVP